MKLKKTKWLLLTLFLMSLNLVAQITSTEGLENIETIQGDLIISKTQLSNLDGLEGLNTVSGNVVIRNNELLTNYCGLQKLLSTGTIGGEVIIEGNSIDLDISNLNFSDCNILGIDDYQYDTTFSTYPNPVIDILHFFNSDNIKTVSIFNTMGQKVFSKENIRTKMNISQLTSGYYFIKIQDVNNDIIIINKVLKK